MRWLKNMVLRWAHQYNTTDCGQDYPQPHNPSCPPPSVTSGMVYAFAVFPISGGYILHTEAKQTHTAGHGYSPNIDPKLEFVATPDALVKRIVATHTAQKLGV